MKVGSLFAEIGFKVDNSGLEHFSNALKSFQKQIRSGLNDLRAYANAARELANAMRDISYVPSQRDAAARYRAETRRISSQARLTSVRARQFVQDSNTRASNADSRARQVALRERGARGGRGSAGHWSRTDNIVRAITMLSPSTLFSSLGSAIGGLFGPMSAAIGAHIGQMIDKVIAAIFRATTWLGKTILSGIRFGMAYRDYRNFTGRSTSGLGGMMARTFNTANMNPEDVLKDAARLETEYWDMILGGGNPAIYQLLGVHPTGNGEVDMRNLLAAIGRATGGFSNRGLARSLIKQTGLGEEYLNMMLDKNPGAVDINRLLSQTMEWEETNKAIREFQYGLKILAGDIAKEFVSSGLLDEIKRWMRDIARNLPSIVQMFKDLFSVLRSFLDWLRETFPSAFGLTPEQIQNESAFRVYEDIAKKMGGGDSFDWAMFKTMMSRPMDTHRAMGDTDFGISDLLIPASWIRRATTGFQMNNNYYVKDPEQAAETTAAVTKKVQEVALDGGQPIQGQINDSFSQATQ